MPYLILRYLFEFGHVHVEVLSAQGILLDLAVFFLEDFVHFLDENEGLSILTWAPQGT